MMLLVLLLTFTRTAALVPLSSFHNPLHRAFLNPHHRRLSSSSSVTTTSLKLEKSSHNNQLLDLPSPILRHQYSILRHGQSLANVAGIISSDPNIATKQHGLSNLGQKQVHNAAVQFAEQFNPDLYQGVMIVSSDFKRAYETALILSDTLSLMNIPLYQNENGIVTTDVRLRERNFGELNGGSDARYQDVWDIDVTNPNHTEFGVECVNSVLRRTTGLVLELEEVLGSSSTCTEEDDAVVEDDEEGGVVVVGKPWRCVLVAHGDVLQILQTGFAKKVDGRVHRNMEHLETATMRDLVLAD